MALPQCLISFCIGATYDTLPSPSNLARWGKQETKACTLCSKNICTVAHILGACPISLKQGRFTYRHDNVLSGLVKDIKSFLTSYTPVLSSKCDISFVPEGKSSTTSKKKKPHIGLLHSANDWIVLTDLESPLVVPTYLAVTQ